MKSFLLPLIIFYLGSACKKQEIKFYSQPVPSTPSLPVDTTTARSYLALGDSYTIGQSVAIHERFPNQTAEFLNGEGIKIANPEIIAQTGWTTGDLLKRINTNPPLKSSYDIVTILIGVNNQYQHLSQDQYRDEFNLLLNKAMEYAGHKKDVFLFYRYRITALPHF